MATSAKKFCLGVAGEGRSPKIAGSPEFQKGLALHPLYERLKGANDNVEQQAAAEELAHEINRFVAETAELVHQVTVELPIATIDLIQLSCCPEVGDFVLGVIRNVNKLLEPLGPFYDPWQILRHQRESLTEE